MKNNLETMIEKCVGEKEREREGGREERRERVSIGVSEKGP